MRAGTIVASNYLEMARLLAESFLAQHPGDSFTILVVDDLPVGDLGGTAEGNLDFDIVRLADLDLGDDELDMMKTIYDVMELSTAVKPSFLKLLLESDPIAVYLDPDIFVYAPFGELIAPVADEGIVLTPHVLRPIPRDGTGPTERNIMGSGIFNLGFIGVSPGAAEFLDWWQERLLVDAVSDIEANLFTDQRWIDWVPALFGCHVCHDPAMNIAWWNIHERTLERAGDDAGYAVAGSPLRFVHFSGYDPATPDRLSKHQQKPRTADAQGLPIRHLSDGYGAALEANGHHARRRTPYQWNTAASGRDLPAFVRSAVRRGLLHGERTGTEAGPLDTSVPMAFGPSAERFEDWLAEDVIVTPSASISRAELALYESRPDLRAAFPRADVQDAERYVDWLRGEPSAKESLGDRWRVHPVVAPVTGTVSADEAPSPGLAQRIVGRVRREIALSARRVRAKVSRS